MVVISFAGGTRMCEKESSGLSESREQAVRAELHRLLESSAFRTSKRCREFLEYVVNHTISGPNGTLKERSLGVELFQLPLDFDTGQHTIVRVTANEVRKKLAQHYLAENGSYHPVRINLPPGAYSAEFKWETQTVEVPAAETQAVDTSDAETQVVEAPAVETPLEETHRPARPSWLTHRVIACAVAVLLLASALAAWRWRAVDTTSVDAKSPLVSNSKLPAAAAAENLRM